MSGSTLALVVTLAIELPIVALFYRATWRRTLVLALVVNVVTNSLLNRAWLVLVPWHGLALVSGEALSFAIEALAYRRHDRDAAIAASATANLASFAGGPLLVALLRP